MKINATRFRNNRFRPQRLRLTPIRLTEVTGTLSLLIELVHVRKFEITGACTRVGIDDVDMHTCGNPDGQTTHI